FKRLEGGGSFANRTMENGRICGSNKAGDYQTVSLIILAYEWLAEAVRACGYDMMAVFGFDDSADSAILPFMRTTRFNSPSKNGESACIRFGLRNVSSTESHRVFFTSRIFKR